MSTRAGIMRQDASGLEVQTYTGWNWPCFFFGSLWYLVKGMWGPGLTWLIFSALTAGVLHLVGILIMPMKANMQYREHLATRGYRLREVTAEEKARALENAKHRTTGYVVIGGVLGALFLLGLLLSSWSR